MITILKYMFSIENLLYIKLYIYYQKKSIDYRIPRSNLERLTVPIWRHVILLVV